jgi:hypothetical protein
MEYVLLGAMVLAWAMMWRHIYLRLRADYGMDFPRLFAAACCGGAFCAFVVIAALRLLSSPSEDSVSSLRVQICSGLAAFVATSLPLGILRMTRLLRSSNDVRTPNQPQGRERPERDRNVAAEKLPERDNGSAEEEGGP